MDWQESLATIVSAWISPTTNWPLFLAWRISSSFRNWFWTTTNSTISKRYRIYRPWPLWAWTIIRCILFREIMKEMKFLRKPCVSKGIHENLYKKEKLLEILSFLILSISLTLFVMRHLRRIFRHVETERISHSSFLDIQYRQSPR